MINYLLPRTVSKNSNKKNEEKKAVVGITNYYYSKIKHLKIWRATVKFLRLSLSLFLDALFDNLLKKKVKRIISLEIERETRYFRYSCPIKYFFLYVSFSKI